MQKPKPKEKQEPAKKSIIRMMLFALAAFLVLAVASIWSMISPIISATMFQSPARKEFNRGMQLLTTDRKQGRQLIEKALADAASNGDSRVDRMNMIKSYSVALYDINDWKSADKQIDNLIALCPKNASLSSVETIALACAYQDRAYHAHTRFIYVNNHTGPSGVKDQEMAVAIEEKAFGPYDLETVYKLPFLAIIYEDIGLKDKAHQTMQSALDTVKTKPLLAPVGWYVHAYNAHLLGLEHNYKAAIAEMLLARSQASNDSDRYRAFTEFDDGVRQGTPDRVPEVQNVAKLFAQGDFAALDQLADRLRQDHSPLPDGAWKIDTFYNKFPYTKHDRTEQDYAQYFRLLAKWLKQNPHSIAARESLSDCYLNYAWFARGGGNSDSVSKKGWKLFAERADQARFALDDGAKLSEKDPRTFVNYATVALAQGWPMDKYMQMVNACHAQWPEYRTADMRACYFLTPRWYGNQGDTGKFMKSRCEQVKGAKGKELYAQLLGYVYPYIAEIGAQDYNIFNSETTLDWSLAKSGFKNLLADYPHDIGIRETYIYVATLAHDDDAIKTAYDGFQP